MRFVEEASLSLIAHREISRNGVGLLSKPSKYETIADIEAARGAVEVLFNCFSLRATTFF